MNPISLTNVLPKFLERNIEPVSGQLVLNFLWRENTYFFDNVGQVGMFYVTGRNKIRDPIIFIQSDKIYGHYNQPVWTTYDVLN